MMTPLYKRPIADEIARYLPTDDIIVIHGARQVGKTSILMYFEKQLREQMEQTLYIDLEDSRFVSLLNRGVDEFLNYLRGEGFDLPTYAQSGKKLYVLIDEIQYLAEPSSFLKLIADHHRYLKLIVSGSSSFEMKSKFKDSLVGRTVNFEIYPLSFREFLVFKGIPFQPADHYTDRKVGELRSLYLEFALFGGYPKIVLTPDVSMKEKYLQQIIDTYIRKDIRDLAEIKEISKFNRLLEVLSSQSGNLLNVSEIGNTCALSLETVGRYIFLLEQSYIIRLVRPFHRNIRSELFKTPKVFFYDTGLMQMLWLKRLQKELLGPVFETSVFAELVKQYGVDHVNFWRTKDKKEIDFVVKFQESFLPMEVKLNFPRLPPGELGYFVENYPSETEAARFKVIGLNGQPSGSGMVYPWQI